MLWAAYRRNNNLSLLSSPCSSLRALASQGQPEPQSMILLRTSTLANQFTAEEAEVCILALQAASTTAAESQGLGGGHEDDGVGS